MKGSVPPMRLKVSNESLLRNSDFISLWTGQTVSLLGSQITLIALPLVAVVTLDATPSQMGILTALEFLPELLFSLVAGALVDRVRRRPILIGADVGRMILLTMIPVAVTFDVLRIEQLYVIGFLIGVFSLLFRTAYSSVLPAVVQRRQLIEANSKLEATRAIAGISGPSIAGAIISIVAAPIAILIDSLSFFVSAFFWRRVRTSERHAPTKGERTSLVREILEGLHFMWRHPLMRPTVLGAGMFNLFDNMRFAVYVLFLTRELGVGPGILGLVFAMASGGGLVGVFLTGWSTQRFGVGPTISGSLALGGIGTLLLPFVSGPMPVVVALLALQQVIFGITGPPLDINIVSLRQVVTPHHLLGRVRSIASFLTLGVLPIGALLGGFLSDIIGLRLMLLVAATGSIFSTVWVVVSPLGQLHDLPPELDE